MAQLEGKVALVSGAGSGIGEAAARRMAAEGAKIAALGRTRDELEAVVEGIQAAGGEAMVVEADVSQADQLQQAYQQVKERWGRLDIVFANAGVNGKWAPLEELEPEDWDMTFDINMKGTYMTLKYALPLLKQRGGSVIITASINGTRVFSNTGASAYASTKAAQVAFAKMTALELAKHHIRVNVICPGAIATEIDDNTQRQDLDAVREPVKYPEGNIPLTDGQPGRAEDVANLVLFLASDASRHITGTEMWIDGAESLIVG